MKNVILFIKVNYKSFSQVVVLGSATFQPFMQLSASQKREVIEDLLDLQIFSTMNSVLKDKVLQNSESISKNEYDRKLIQSKIHVFCSFFFFLNIFIHMHYYYGVLAYLFLFLFLHICI